jgi:hypothetical protein
MDKEYNRKKEVFTVPEGYFEQLNRKILDATVESRTATPRRKSYTLGRFGRVARYAAAVAVLFVLAINILTPGNNASNNVAMNESDEYIDNILNSYTIDDYTFYCYLTNSDFE